MEGNEGRFEQDSRMVKKSIKVFLLLSLLLFSLDAIFILINYYSLKRVLNSQFSQIGKEVEAAFIQAQQATEQRVLQIATFIAADQEVQQLFLAAKEAVSAEGGGRGGPEAAAIREKLYQRVASSRDALAADYDFRQLQFHLAPDALSFLRVHAPEKFGDRMDTVRHTVVAVNRTKQPVSGFETGRVYSGIRGVVPVFADDHQSGRQVYVGALEAGTSYHFTLENTAHPRHVGMEPRHVGMAVLLTLEHLTANVWPDFLEKILYENPPVSGLVLEDTTDPGITFILSRGLLPQDAQDFSWQVVDLTGIPYLIIRFPLYDFAALQDQSQPPVGTVVAWQNISAAQKNFDNSMKTNILYGLFGFILIELLLYFGIHLGTRKMEALVSQGRIDLAHSLEQLQISEEKFQTMAEFSLDWDAWSGTDGKYIYITPSCEEISGYSRDILYEDPGLLFSFLHPDDREKFLAHHRQHYRERTGPAEITFRILRKDGEVRWIWHKCQAVFSADGTWKGRRTTNRDISVLKEAEAKLHYLSRTDLLTGTYNRRMLMDLLSREIKRAGRYGDPFCLLRLAIDHFSVVNDDHGHDAGDRVLIDVVQLSMETIRQSDFLARWGDEEFMILLPQTNPEMAMSLGERLRQRIGEHEFTGIGRLTVSIGVTNLQRVDTVELLLKRVDAALFEAKESGRNRVVSG